MSPEIYIAAACVLAIVLTLWWWTHQRRATPVFETFVKSTLQALSVVAAAGFILYWIFTGGMK